MQETGSAKERVLAVWPDAYVVQESSRRWRAYKRKGLPVHFASARSEEAAWKIAEAIITPLGAARNLPPEPVVKQVEPTGRNTRTAADQAYGLMKQQAARIAELTERAERAEAECGRNLVEARGWRERALSAEAENARLRASLEASEEEMWGWKRCAQKLASEAPHEA